MAILQDATPELRRGMLDLYSVATLREAFQRPGPTKDVITATEAQSDDQAQIDKVAAFVDEYFGCCKQHVYVFDGQQAMPTAIKSGELLLATNTSALFVTQVEFDVITLNPPVQHTAPFLSPVKVEMIHGYLVVRFITLEKNMSSLFGDSSRIVGKSPTEDDVLEDWGLTSGLRADLNKGVKELWEANRFDCTKGRYKKPFAVSQESMDAGRGIKAEYPNIYEAMRYAPIQNSIFKSLDPNEQGLMFSVDPTDGRIGFQAYTKRGLTDAIIGQILASNR